MVDSDADLKRWPQLHQALAACEQLLGEVYRRADRAALRHQQQHRLLTVVAAVCGTAAVLFAIVQLSGLLHLTWLLEVEFLAALAALVAVVLGLVASRQVQWLVQRHKAEHCRLLKFRFLIDPALWCMSGAGFVQRMERLRREAQEVDVLTPRALHRWMEEDDIPEMPGGSDCRGTVGDVRQALMDYYRAKRLDAQIDYFACRARRNLRLDRPTRHLPALFFLASVLAAFAHFVYDIVTTRQGIHELSVLLIVLAAGLPVLGAGVRTVRLAYEFARNATRFRAKLVILRRLAEALKRETDPEAIFRELWCGEQVLESEHREWLRLMAEAEWFG